MSDKGADASGDQRDFGHDPDSFSRLWRRSQKKSLDGCWFLVGLVVCAWRHESMNLTASISPGESRSNARVHGRRQNTLSLRRANSFPCQIQRTIGHAEPCASPGQTSTPSADGNANTTTGSASAQRNPCVSWYFQTLSPNPASPNSSGAACSTVGLSKHSRLPPQVNRGYPVSTSGWRTERGLANPDCLRSSKPAMRARHASAMPTVRIGSQSDAGQGRIITRRTQP